MPIYAFQCTQCGHSFDRLQKIADPDPDTCPKCDAHAIKRQVTAPAFRLAGTGWYETDFKSSKDKKHNLAGGNDTASSSSSDSASPKTTGNDAGSSNATTSSSATPSTPSSAEKTP